MRNKYTRQDIISSFNKRVFKTKHCWFWIGGKDKKTGYGSAYFNKKSIKSHRLAFLLYKSDLKPGLVIMHSCDNPSCVNPEHLNHGTYSENSIDSIKKGRTSSCAKKGKRIVCNRGHDISLDSQVYINKNNPKSGRMCRICKYKPRERINNGQEKSSSEENGLQESQKSIKKSKVKDDLPW